MQTTIAEIKGPVAWRPTPRQAEFLAAPDDEVLYGGAAGGGKSDSLIIDALGLQQDAIKSSAYRAILFRRSFPEVRELIDRTREIYPAMMPGAVFKESAREWEFTSGAKIEFGYCEDDKDRFRYQGRQFGYVGWDELTHWPSPIPFEYLLSRNRCPDPNLKCYCRGTTNPGGFGHEWVKERWRIEDDGGPSRFYVDIEDPDTGEIFRTWRRFIPAKLSDNPHLAENDPTYKAKLLQLSEMERRALLDGRWDVVEIQGAIYQRELEWLYMNNRVTEVPYLPGIPVWTFWDLGRNDNMAIWFMQRVGMANRFFKYHQDSGKQLQHYIAKMQQWRDEGEWTIGGHYHPHDVNVTDLTSADNKSRLEILEDGKIGDIHVVPRIQDLREGIDMTRRAFAPCWFDKEGCKEGLKALRNYRREYDEKNQVFRERPLHNWASNGSDAFRQYAQGFASNDSGSSMNGWRKSRTRRNYRTV